MQSSKKVAFYTLGCKLNFSESSAIARNFENSGYQRAEFDDGADVYVINTCSVTDNANQKCRKIIRQARRKSPDAKIVVIGCYAQLEPQEIAAMPGVDAVLGAAEKFNVSDYIHQLDNRQVQDKALVFASEIKEADFYVDAYSLGDRTRTFLKVQDGCDYKCSFCTIPLARGKSRSDTIENIVRQADDIAAKGIKEVVLTGVNIGDFGKESNGKGRRKDRFLNLIQALDGVQGIERFRISSIEPNLLSPQIISFVASSQKFVPHFHMPLQSGSDAILKLMRRRYDSGLYIDRVSRIKGILPHCCIGVDVITGFPGETDEEFEKTYRFLNELDISYLHVFTYSERPGTKAIEMDGIVPVATRRKRTKRLQSLSVKKRQFFYRQHLGTQRVVLLENEQKGGFMYGFTDNYIKVQVPFNQHLVNNLFRVQLVEFNGSGYVTGAIQDELRKIDGLKNLIYNH